MRSNVHVDPSSGAMQLQIPLGDLPGRGEAGLPVVLRYSSKVWNIKYFSTSPCNGEPVSAYQPEYSKGSASGWTSSDGWFLPQEDATLETYDLISGKPAQQGNLRQIARKYVTLPDGSRHELRRDDSLHTVGEDLSGTYYAVDGSRLWYVTSSDTLFMPNGSRYVNYKFGRVIGNAPLTYIDRNGNSLTYDASSGAWMDTLNRSVGVPVPGSAPVAGDYTFTLPGSTTYTLRWRNLGDALTDPSQPLHYPGDSPSANCTVGIHDPNALFNTINDNNKVLKGTLFNPRVLYQIALPNGTTYTFTYNIYGELNKIVYPTGGFETFGYGFLEPLGGQLDDGTFSQANRGVFSRAVNDGVTPQQVWQYNTAPLETGVDSATVQRSVIAPDGTITRTWYYKSNGANIKYGFDDARTGMPREETIRNSSGTMLRRSLMNVSMDGPLAGGYSTATRNARVTKTVEIILDTGGNALAATTELTYDADLNVTSTTHYHYVSISQTTGQTNDILSFPAGTPLRTEETDYLTSDPNYRARNLLALPTATRIKDGASNVVAQSSISYDEGAYPLLPYGTVIGWSDPGTNARGNATTTSRWLNLNGTTFTTFPSGAYITTHAQYDQCGNVRKVWDARDTGLSNPTQISYTDSFSDAMSRNTYAFPTSITSSIPDATNQYASNSAFVTSSVYDFNTGHVASTTDPNGKTTSYDYTDPLNRLKQVTLPDTGRVRYSYFDTAPDLYVQVLTDEDSSRSVETRQYFDGLGRSTRAFLYDGTASTPWVVTDTYYDNLGRISKVSNPYRVSSPSATEPTTCSECTTNTYDELSRIITVTTPDNAQVTTSYSASTTGILGTTTTVTDQAGRQRRSLTDALGRLVRIDEPDKDTGSLGDVTAPVQATSYSYDVLNDLTGVTQGSQTRSFAYDSLRRLASATNPENGTVSYVYDNNGNLTSKTDARPITITYQYDALNRNYSVNYSNTTIGNPDVPDINRVYDGATNGKGRLWKSYAGGNETVGSNVDKTTIDSYDALGRASQQSQRFKLNGMWGDTDHTYQVSRSYNLAGAVTSQTYPSQHSVTYNYDIAGRLADKDVQNLAFTGNLGDGAPQPRTYSRGMVYTPAGQLKQEQFGNPTTVYNNLFYNSRQQLVEILANTTGSSSLMNRGRIVNQYDCSGVGCNGTENNGNLRKQEMHIPNDEQGSTETTWFEQFDYDYLNRLKRVHEYTSNTNLDWQQEFDYDRWGNRTINQTNTWGTGIPKPNFSVNTSTNRLTAPIGYSMNYDLAGNLTTDTYSGGGDRVYDAENRMTQAWGGSSQWQYYTYDADGHRTRRKINNQETWQIYGFDGELVAEYAANASIGSPQKEYGYRSGQLLVTAEAPSTFNGYTNRRTITIDHTKVPNTDQSNFPVLISGTYSYLATTANGGNVLNANGYDVIFTSDSGCATKLNHEVESYSATTGAVNYWVKVPSVSHTTDTTIYICYGNSAITTDQSNKTSVWDTNYKGVWHLSDNAANTTVIDSTGTNNGTNQANTSSKTATGKTGKALTYNGSSDYTDLGSNVGNYTLSTSFTLEAWINPSLDSANRAIYGNAYALAGYLLRVNTANKARFVVCTNGSNWSGRDSSLLTSGWHHVVAEWNGSGTAHLYIDGALDDAASVGGGSVTTITTSAHTRIGAAPESGYESYFNGSIDEVRSSNTARSADWIKTEYNNQNSPNTFYSISSATAASANLHWLVTDQLGTPRMVFDESGSLANVKRHDYLPFGEEIGANVGSRTTTQGYSSSDGVRQQFTSKERDNETGLDHFFARDYSSTQGRFIGADSFGGRTVNPQTLNLYAYVLNNPLKLVDPFGHQDDLPQKKGKKGNPDEDPPPDDVPLDVVVINSKPGLGDPPPIPRLTSTVDNITQDLQRWTLKLQRFDFRVITFGMSPISSTISLVGGEDAVREYHHTTMALLPLALESGIEMATEESTAALEGNLDAVVEGTLFRNGAFTEMNFTPRVADASSGLSTFDTLEAATAPGGKAQVIDVSRLSNLKAEPNGPPGHYGIFPRAEKMQEWISSRGTTQVHELTRELMNARTHEVRRPKS